MKQAKYIIYSLHLSLSQVFLIRFCQWIKNDQGQENEVGCAQLFFVINKVIHQPSVTRNDDYIHGHRCYNRKSMTAHTHTLLCVWVCSVSWLRYFLVKVIIVESLFNVAVLWFTRWTPIHDEISPQWYLFFWGACAQLINKSIDLLIQRWSCTQIYLIRFSIPLVGITRRFTVIVKI